MILLIFLVGSLLIELGFRFYAMPYIRLVNEPTPRANTVALVLGTAPTTSDGRSNIFFEGRMQRAAQVYRDFGADCLLLSGDNTSLEYNEPVSMQHRLLELGVPAERMYLDYAGIRTLDSVLRARDIFGLSGFVIISQPFHLERAVTIARASGLQATGYAAESVALMTAPRVYLRAIASEWVALYDILFETGAKFAGERIPIDTRSDVRPVPARTCAPRG